MGMTKGTQHSPDPCINAEPRQERGQLRNTKRSPQEISLADLPSINERKGSTKPLPPFFGGKASPSQSRNMVQNTQQRFDFLAGAQDILPLGLSPVVDGFVRTDNLLLQQHSVKPDVVTQDRVLPEFWRSPFDPLCPEQTIDPDSRDRQKQIQRLPAVAIGGGRDHLFE